MYLQLTSQTRDMTWHHCVATVPCTHPAARITDAAKKVPLSNSGNFITQLALKRQIKLHWNIYVQYQSQVRCQFIIKVKWF